MRFSFAYLLPTACCLLAILPACKQKPDYSKDIANLDSALLELAVIHKALTEVDTVKISSLISETDAKLKPVSAQLSSDTIRKVQALFLSDCFGAEQRLEQAMENRKYYLTALTDAKKRIENLEHDLMKNVIEENKARGYIVNELNALSKLRGSAADMHDKMITTAAMLDSLQPKITAFADSLQSK